MLAIRKLQSGRRLLEIRAEQFAKQSARRDKPASIVCKMKSIGSGRFVRRERRFQLAKLGCLAVEPRLPDVDFVPELFPFR
jgi:hypothetical protein